MLDESRLGKPEDVLRKLPIKLWGHSIEVFDLSHPFSEKTPTWPFVAENAQIIRIRSHAKDRVLAHKLCHTMHMSTHTDAPLHVEDGYPSIDEVPIDRYIGEGVVVSIPKKKWEIITPDDLENVDPPIERGDIVIINTGWHHHYGDNITYFCYAPGLYKEAGEWFVKKGVKAVGVDLPAMDHPLGTRLAQGAGHPPLMPWLLEEYKKETGRDVYEDFPYWEPCHRILYTHGIVGFENIGGDVDKVTGKRCLIIGMPLKWVGGDGSMVRPIAIVGKQ
ncbi:MAG: cyclase family protein [Candidatus Caldarchaeum sp.]